MKNRGFLSAWPQFGALRWAVPEAQRGRVGIQLAVGRSILCLGLAHFHSCSASSWLPSGCGSGCGEMTNTGLPASAGRAKRKLNARAGVGGVEAPAFEAGAARPALLRNAGASAGAISSGRGSFSATASGSYLECRVTFSADLAVITCKRSSASFGSLWPGICSDPASAARTCSCSAACPWASSASSISHCSIPESRCGHLHRRRLSLLPVMTQ